MESYSNLELLLEMRSLAIWKPSDHKDVLQNNLSALASRLEILISREREQRGVKQASYVAPVGVLEDCRGLPFIPAE